MKNIGYVCGGIIFTSYELAVSYANNMYENRGYILGIEKVRAKGVETL